MIYFCVNHLRNNCDQLLGETLAGRQPGLSRCGENEAKFGERWESQESQVCSNVINSLPTNVMKVRPIMV